MSLEIMDKSIDENISAYHSIALSQLHLILGVEIYKITHV
jgi:hypothetical protein